MCCLRHWQSWRSCPSRCCTCAGLGARASSTCAIERIYHIKGRPSRLPLAICVADASAVQQYGDCQHVSPALLQSLLPGPVTLVLRRREDARLAAQLNPGVATIGAALVGIEQCMTRNCEL